MPLNNDELESYHYHQIQEHVQLARASKAAAKGHWLIAHLARRRAGQHYHAMMWLLEHAAEMAA